MASTPQWPVNFVPVGAILERLDCSQKRLQGQGSPTLQAVGFSYTTARRDEVLHPMIPSPPHDPLSPLLPCITNKSDKILYFI